MNGTPSSRPGAAGRRIEVIRPGWAAERRFWREGSSRVAGVDEVGRGPLAGPVVAAAVVLPCGRNGAPSRAGWIRELADSKVLSAARREALGAIIERECDWGLAVVSPQVIDQVNIRQATRLAMHRAVEALLPRPDALIIDGTDHVDGGIPQRSLPDADAYCVSVAAASIVAKVARDRMMCELDARFPGYGLASNKGYATRDHREALARLGYSNVHRLSFAPVRQAVHP